jgi:hypothetical protein
VSGRVGACSKQQAEDNRGGWHKASENDWILSGEWRVGFRVVVLFSECSNKERGPRKGIILDVVPDAISGLFFFSLYMS